MRRIDNNAAANAGFTLIELMITIVIIAVIAAIAVPNYTDYVTRSKFTEAQGQLSDLRIKMEQYYQDNRRYSTTVGGGTCGIGAAPAPGGTKYFTYACTSTNRNAAGDQEFTLTASGKADQGLDGIAFTINHANTRATTVDSSKQMGQKGYATNTGCWVVKKPSQC
jgi:type IV pilus assembly protein PilE